MFFIKKLTVLVTGAKAPGFVSIVRSLKLSKKYKFKIIGTDWKKSLGASYFADEDFILPSNDDPEFPEALLDTIKKEKVDVLLPIRTNDLLPICQRLKEFREEGTEPALPTTNPSLLNIALDKYKLLEYTQNIIELETPVFYKAKTLEELKKRVEELGYPNNPVCIKPTRSNGSRGFRILDNQIDRKSLFFNEKPNHVYSTLDRVIEDIGESFPPLIVMEFLPGKEYTLDVLCRKGITFAILPRFRKAMRGGITTEGVLQRDRNYDEMCLFSEKIIEGFGFSYNIGIQMKEDRKGKVRLLEVNPRLQGTTIINTASGVNIPEKMVEMALGIFDYNFKPQIKWNTELERVYFEIFNYEGTVWHQ
ncbi:MAG: ATP-grasp domain-containing protein [Candidatus Hodarchaeota archaeon]